MQEVLRAKPQPLSAPMISLGVAFTLFLTAVATGLLLHQRHFGLAAILLGKTALGCLFFRSTAQLREQHIRTSPSNEITRRVALALENSLLQMLLLSILLDILFCSVSTLLTFQP